MQLDLSNELFQMLHKHKSDTQCYKSYMVEILTEALYKREYGGNDGKYEHHIEVDGMSQTIKLQTHEELMDYLDSLEDSE